MITLEGESIRKVDPHRHKYTDAMAEYLDYIGGMRMMFDNDCGDVEAPTGWFCRFGKRILFHDSRGFVSVDYWPTEADARKMFDLAADEYYAWDSQDEEEA